MHGVHETIKQFHDNYEIVCYQQTPVRPDSIRDMEFPVYTIPYNKAAPMLMDAIKALFDWLPKDNERALFWQHMKSSDIVVNIFGICFCSNFQARSYFYFRAVRSAVSQFLVSVMAKLHRKKTVKCTCSYGPIISKNDLVAARFSARYIFDVMCAREMESSRQMKNIAQIKKQVPVFPDIANAMKPGDNSEPQLERTIGISVSHQIIKQWKSEEPYLCCLEKLINHIHCRYGCNILLIPNEVSDKLAYNDASVAKDLMQMLTGSGKVAILNTAKMTSSELKTTISQCDLLVASRYHSCVAALSAGVPTLVVGWHHKYAELLSHYGQQQWMVAHTDCTSSKLIDMFDALWNQREAVHNEIETKRQRVLDLVKKSGTLMFMK